MTYTERITKRIIIILVFATLHLGTTPVSSQAAEPLLPDDAVAKLLAAAPQEASAKPKRPRKVLVITEDPERLARSRKTEARNKLQSVIRERFLKGWVPNEDRGSYTVHKSAAYCAKAFAVMGEKTGAYEAVLTAKPRFTPEDLNSFDAIVIANIYLEDKLFSCRRSIDPRAQQTFKAQQKALLDFVAGGKGIVAVHAAAIEALGWPEYNRMIGGKHHGHAWHAHQAVQIKLDDPKHSLNAAFGGKGFSIDDDIYVFAEPYSRRTLRVLMSVDVNKAPKSETAYRSDGDYPVSWVKNYGKGRVFYFALGENPATFQNPKVLRHLLDGLQFALGDLPADTTPSGPLKEPRAAGVAGKEGWTPLFNGKDLAGWQVAAWRGGSPREAPEDSRGNWFVENGIIRFDVKNKKGGYDLCSRDAFGDFSIKLDWRMPRGSDSGVFGRWGGQVNIWCWAMGSGELWGRRGNLKRFTEEQSKSFTPSKNADKPVGEWNTFIITMKGDRLTIVLNGREVISRVQLPGVRASGPIGLQNHGTRMDFKDIYIKKLD